MVLFIHCTLYKYNESADEYETLDSTVSAKII